MSTECEQRGEIIRSSSLLVLKIVRSKRALDKQTVFTLPMKAMPRFETIKSISMSSSKRPATPQY